MGLYTINELIFFQEDKMKQIFTTLVLLFSVEVSIAQDFWETVPIPTGVADEIKSIAISPTDKILVGTSTFTSSKLFQSTDGGNNWTQLTYNGMIVNTIMFLPNGDILIGESMGMKKSTDNGTGWSNTNGMNPGSNPFCLTRKADGTLYAGTSTGVYKSIDNGDNWARISNGLPANNPYVYSIAVNNSGILFAGVNELITGKGVFRSTDDGQNWVQINNGMGGQYTINSIAVKGNDIYCGTIINGIFKSTDNGDNWTLVHSRTASCKSLFVTADGTILAGFNGFQAGIVYSQDNGATWIPLNTGFQTPFNINTIAQNSQGIFFTGGMTNGKLYRSTQTLTSVEDGEITPINFILHQNYPNPFNPSTKISWQVPVGSHQTLKVYDILGNEVATLVDEYRDAGSYEVEFNLKQTSSLSSGVYFYKLQAGDYVQIKKMMLMK